MRYDSAGQNIHLTHARTRLDKTRKKYDLRMDDEPYSLTDRDDRISIVDIEEQPQYTSTTVTRGKYDGLALQKAGRKSLKVVVTIHLKAWEPESYVELVTRINTWAHQGKLRVNYRPNQYLDGGFTRYPSLDPQNWTETVVLEYTAFAFPYWQADKIVTLTGTVPTSGTHVYITPVGDAPYCFLEGVFTNTGSAKCDYFTITAQTKSNGMGKSSFTVMQFQGLDHYPDEAFAIEYDKYGYLKLWRYTQNISAIKCRTGESSDDLVLRPGKENEIFLQSAQPYSFVLSARGAYM